MPRVSRAKPRHHASAAVLPSKRTFAVPDAQVESVLPVGTVVSGHGGNDYIVDGDTANEAETSAAGSRKQRLAAAVSAQTPTPLSHPYSRSHLKRLRKKSRQNLSGGELHPLAAALAESLGQTGEKDKKAHVRSMAEKEEEARRERAKKLEEGKIGEGRGRTLGEKRRREIISTESKRREAILSHTQFKASPWATIRLHAENSLASKEKPQSASAKAKAGRKGLDVVGKGDKRSGGMEVEP